MKYLPLQELLSLPKTSKKITGSCYICVFIMKPNIAVNGTIEQNTKYSPVVKGSKQTTYYSFGDKDNIVSSTILFNTDSMLLDWLKNNDVIYVVYGLLGSGLQNHTAYVYVINLDDFIRQDLTKPRLIEYCNWGIAGGTSKREISHCINFNQTGVPLYLDEKDLP